MSCPRFDDKIPRKNGFMWASECDLECLQFWFGKFSVSSNPLYAEKDQKKAKAIGYWIEYRQADPWGRWKGKRGSMEVVANQPVNKPTIFPWDNSRSSTPSPLPEQDPTDNRGDAWEGGGDDPIPF